MVDRAPTTLQVPGRTNDDPGAVEFERAAASHRKAIPSPHCLGQRSGSPPLAGLEEKRLAHRARSRVVYDQAELNKIAESYGGAARPRGAAVGMTGDRPLGSRRRR
jgi:hypothetical protein